MHQCLLCKGKLEKGKVNHVVDIDDLIIIIKKVPAEICKQCGEYYLDHKVAQKVEDIVENFGMILVCIAVKGLYFSTIKPNLLFLC